MKKRMMTAIAAICLAGAANADPLEGIWQTAKDDNGNFGFVQVAPCGAALCGRLIKSFDTDANEIPSDFTGQSIISETVPEGGGAYSGKIFSPDRGKTYSSSLELNGDQLAVSGCVFGICRSSGVWLRVQ
ncbi:DUF2147 domain-containing protein [Yoonia sediminilitoris]|uniref:Uncharacterized protein (DUF2147 family) n=1 Tax=Yoonia sediminilitoris TaxID=1286148 RepID=A0A2T6KER0_9RHOB|nr:DUF2147 domain-containing protein [Yoonia sediminilitoris]PUB13622.1 uncharacterized protein (DUF2147 family) [Yoonia sediminilitoris]RCW94792.1 uncharacterized protein (DUF2147 family) [Yoonia sediminilitoris]